MTKPFPMLAAPVDLPKLKYPMLGFPKLDGIRFVAHEGEALSRKLIALPNRHIQQFFRDNSELNGLDGEICVGAPNDHLCIKHSTSGVMSRDGEPDFGLYVFDKWDEPKGYHERHYAAYQRADLIKGGRVHILTFEELRTEADVLEFEQGCLDDGFEGIILRDPMGAYKHGRSTVREGGLLKMKRFLDSEAEVLEVIEEMHNGNEAQKDNLGRTKRSSAKDAKTGKGRAGALLVRDIKTKVEFEIGTGMNDSDKAEWWSWWMSDRAPRLVRYKFFPVGMQEKPRHAVYLTFRLPMDT